MKEYYLVSLNNNDSIDSMKLKNIIYSEEYNLPDAFLESVKEIKYYPVDILAVKSVYSLRDVITGEVLLESDDGYVNGLSYSNAIKANRNDIIRITKLYESMSSDDIKRYKEKIEEIKENSIKRYKEKEINSKRMLLEEENARNFLSNLESWG